MIPNIVAGQQYRIIPKDWRGPKETAKLLSGAVVEVVFVGDEDARVRLTHEYRDRWPHREFPLSVRHLQPLQTAKESDRQINAAFTRGLHGSRHR